MSKGSLRLLKTLMTTLLLVVVLRLGPGNWPLMRMARWGTPKGEMVSKVTFHVKNRYGSSLWEIPRIANSTSSAAAACGPIINLPTIPTFACCRFVRGERREKEWGERERAR